jgi:GT2 family glycosyltransferase
VLGAYVRYINEKGRPLFIRYVPTEHSQIVFCNLTNWGSFLMHPSVMMRRQAFIEAGGYDEYFLKSQDYDLWFRIEQYGKLANLPEVLLDYRHHCSAISQLSANGQAIFMRKILRGELAKRGMLQANALKEEFQILLKDPAWLAMAAARSGFLRTYFLEALRASKRSLLTLFKIYGDLAKCVLQAAKNQS